MRVHRGKGVWGHSDRAAICKPERSFQGNHPRQHRDLRRPAPPQTGAAAFFKHLVCRADAHRA